jgi:hypothetical protein
MGRPKKTGHKSHDKIMEQDYQAKRIAEGHNSGGINPEVQNLFAEDEKLEDAIKVLQKDRKAIRVRAKEEFGIPLRVWAIEKAMRKLDVNVRAEIEQAHSDLKMMIGYQMALNLVAPAAKDEENDPVEAASRKVTGIRSGSPALKTVQPEADEFEDE